MSVNRYNSTTGELERISGGTLYADAPVGSIQAYGGTTAPLGWLLCQGQAVSRTEYAELFKAIGIAFGSGDGSTTFNVPDLRETVPVGSGTRENEVVNHDVYTLGEFKDDQLKDHHHHVYGVQATLSGSGYPVLTDTQYNVNGKTRGVDDAVATVGTTTHGKQLGVNYIIKAKQVAVPTDFSKSLVGYVGQETDYNLYPWSDTKTSTKATYLDFTVEQDGWYSVDFTLTQSSADNNGFAIRDFDEQGETHLIGRGEINGCTYYRNNIIVPLKAGMYRYLHSGIGSLSVYMNRRDFA